MKEENKIAWKPKKKVKEEEIEEIEEEPEEIEEEIEEEEKPKLKKTSDVWVVQEVPTQTTEIIFNNKTKKAYDLVSAVVELLNRTEQ